MYKKGYGGVGVDLGTFKNLQKREDEGEAEAPQPGVSPQLGLNAGERGLCLRSLSPEG